MYSTVIDIHRLRQKEQKQYFQRNSVYSREAGDLRAFGLDAAARLASNSLLAFSSRAGSQGSAEEEEVLLGDEYRRCSEQARLDCSFAGLLAPLYKDRSFCGPGFGLGRSDSMRHQWSVDGDGEKRGHHTGSIVSSSISAFTLPVIKLNNCVIDEPEMEAITEEDRGGERRDGERSMPLSSMESLVVPVASVAKASKPLGLQRSNSASSSSRSSSFSSCTLSPAPSSTSGCWLSPGVARSDFGSNTSLHMLNSHSKSLDLERGPSMLSVHQEQRKHPSWPRLDRSNSSRSHSGNWGSAKGYARLEDREEQGERLSDASASAMARRDFSKREKLLMISRSHNNLSFEHDEFNNRTLKRGSSETRFWRNDWWKLWPGLYQVLHTSQVSTKGTLKKYDIERAKSKVVEIIFLFQQRLVAVVINGWTWTVKDLSFMSTCCSTTEVLQLPNTWRKKFPPGINQMASRYTISLLQSLSNVSGFSSTLMLNKDGGLQDSTQRPCYPAGMFYWPFPGTLGERIAAKPPNMQQF